VKYLFLFLILVPCVFASGLGVSPVEIDFDNESVKQIFIINPTDSNKSISFASTSVTIKAEETFWVGALEKKVANISLDFSSCPDPGFYEELLLIRDETSLGAGVAVKVRYNVTSECASVESYELVEEIVSNDYWIYVIIGLLVLVGGYFGFRLYRNNS
jgi:hypothetical protein